MKKVTIHLTVENGYIRADEIRADKSRGLNLYHYDADAYPNDLARFAAMIDRVMFDQRGKEILFTTETEFQNALDTVIAAVRSGKMLITL